LVFGTADATNHRNLEAIKEIVAHNIGSVIRIVVRRKNRPDAKDKWLLCDLQLTPQQWKGRGMLGCVIMPFEEITSEEP
jgi:26S proteasome non-ATPase regulatory subunit 9